MSTASLTLPRRVALRVDPRLAPPAMVLAACAAFMFIGGPTPPIVLWDESRIAVNALEMHLAGHLSLVATYGFAPDLWNTKPPLLIWLIDAAVGLFGVSEWAVRLPSALAAMGTLALVLSFTRRVTGSFRAGALATGMLATSIVFFGEHGARTADYEALLTLFTTAYLYVLFFALHRRRPGWRRALLAGGLIALAVMTKSVAGLTPGLGVLVYLLVVRRWRRPFQPPWLAGALPLALAPPLAFYGMREAAAPGYLNAVIHNDLSGRFSRALDRHAGPPWYYVERLVKDVAFAGGWLTALAPPALAWTRGRARLGLFYSVCVAAALLVALSFSATKLLHYAAPAAPFLAIATAIALHASLQALARRNARPTGRLLWRSAQAVIAGLLIFDLILAICFRASWLPTHEFEPQSRYGELIAAAARERPSRLALVDDGVTGASVVAEGLAADYAPQLDFYRELARATGQDVSRIAPADVARWPSGALLGSCDAREIPAIWPLGPALPAAPGCALIRRR